MTPVTAFNVFPYVINNAVTFFMPRNKIFTIPVHEKCELYGKNRSFNPHNYSLSTINGKTYVMDNLPEYVETSVSYKGNHQHAINRKMVNITRDEWVRLVHMGGKYKVEDIVNNVVLLSSNKKFFLVHITEIKSNSFK